MLLVVGYKTTYISTLYEFCNSALVTVLRVSLGQNFFVGTLLQKVLKSSKSVLKQFLIGAITPC